MNKNVDVLLSPSTYQTYKVKFEAINLPFQVIDHNIQEYLFKFVSIVTNNFYIKFYRKTDKQRRTMKTNRAGSIVGTFARYTEVIRLSSRNKISNYSYIFL